MQGIVDLWIEPLTFKSDESAYLWSLLSPDERIRADRFHFASHRGRFIKGRALLRRILADYLSTDPTTLSFVYNDFGKPALASAPSDLRFNLSHSGDVAAYAVTNGRDIGVDIEHLRSDFAEDRIPERFFSPGEVQALRSLPADQQNEAFFLCWTRKEAYVKALAHGLSIPLDSFDVSLRPGEEARFLRNGQGWSIGSFAVPGCVGAIVAPGNDWTWRFANPSAPAGSYSDSR